MDEVSYISCVNYGNYLDHRWLSQVEAHFNREELGRLGFVGRQGGGGGDVEEEGGEEEGDGGRLGNRKT